MKLFYSVYWDYDRHPTDTGCRRYYVMYHAVVANYRHLDENKEDFGFFVNLRTNEDNHEVSIRVAFRVT